jgi:ribosome biogenesis GTPase
MIYCWIFSVCYYFGGSYFYIDGGGYLMKLEGKIIKINSGFYYIKSKGQVYITRGSGNLRQEGHVPLVGDYVVFEKDGFVLKILDRKNFFDRPKISNIDQIIIVMSLAEPKFKSLLLNKFLAIFENKNIEPIILFTKSDISELRPENEYINNGYKCFTISNITKKNILKLTSLFKNKTTGFVGQTGVGKSSTINSLTGLDLKTNTISKALGRGKHTTRITQIYDWYGGELIDTPGFSSIDFDLTKEELSKAYHDFRLLSKRCEFRNCLHVNEKNCAIKIAVKDKKIYLERYNDYIKLLKGIENGKTWRINTLRT